MIAFVLGVNQPDKIGALTREDLRMQPYQRHVVLASYEGDDAVAMAEAHCGHLASGRAADWFDGFLVAVAGGKAADS